MVEHIFPNWSRTLGAMARRPLHVRSRCVGCGIQLRVDAAVLCAVHGPSAMLIDRIDRCAVVGCDGAIYYEVSLPFRQSWIRLVSKPALIELIETEAAAPVTAPLIRDRRACP